MYDNSRGAEEQGSPFGGANPSPRHSRADGNPEAPSPRHSRADGNPVPSSPNNQLAVLDTSGRLVEVLPPETPSPQNWGAGGAFLDALRAALVGAAPPVIPNEDKPFLWAEAFAQWIANSPRTGSPRPMATLKAYTAAWNDFRAFHGKQDWLVTTGDVRGWLDDLRSRPIDPTVGRGLERNGRRAPGQMGLSDSTISQWLAAISSFYAYAGDYPVPVLDGRELPLFDGVNPARASSVPRPRTAAFATATYLTSKQVDALLSAIEAYGHSAPSRNARGLRDYALFVCYLLTGGRNSEIRAWRWQDLSKRPDGVYYHWANKGKSGWDQLPPPAWRAVHMYLRLSGRLPPPRNRGGQGGPPSNPATTSSPPSPTT